MFSTKSLVLLPLLASLLTFTSAAPLKPEPLHRLQLRKNPSTRDGEHPHMAYQRHHNSAVKRIHHLTGSTPPDDSFFRDLIIRKRDMLERSGEFEKRIVILPDNDGTPTKRRRDSGTEGGAAQPTITVTASGSNSNGFSEADAEVSYGNTVTGSSSALIQGGIDLDIWANDNAYLADISIGTPSRSFSMIIDTGSADTWVPSTQCDQCGPHQATGSDVSSTFADLNRPWNITYGSGNVSGTIAQDTMVIAGMTLENQVFGVTTTESDPFSAADVPADGLLGLAFQTISRQRTPTPIDSLQSSGQIKEAILGLALGRIADGSNDGEIVFGGADQSKIDASTTQTLPLSRDAGFWEVSMGAVTINGNIIATDRQAILDSGTTLVLGPSADIAAFHAQIDGAQYVGVGTYTIPCTTDAVVSMTFGNAAFQIDARDLIFLPAGSSLTGDCYSSIGSFESLSNTTTTWLLGDVFLKNVYMTTNVQQRTVQLSGRTDLPTSTSSRN